MHSQSREFGGILGKLLGLLLLAALLAGGWWWFMGRFTLPENPPSKPSRVGAVLDYEGRRDLGTDPLDAMVRPDPKTGRAGDITRKLVYAQWFAEYSATVLARGKWRVLDQLGASAGSSSDTWKDNVREAHLTYLHHAQLAEYQRATWLAEGGD